MQKIIPLLLYVLFVHVANKSFAQSDIRLSVSSTYSSCNVGGLQSDTNGDLILSGTYSRSSVNEFSKLYVNEKSTPILGEKGIYLLKLDEKREIVWSTSIELKLISNVVTTNIVLDDSSNIYLSGKFDGQLIFDSKNSLESATGDDFIAKYTAKGVFKWAKKLAGTNNTFNYKNKIDKDNNIYFIGKFSGSLEFENKVLHNTTQDVAQSYVLVLDRNGKYVKSESFDPNIDFNFIEINEKNEAFIAGNFSNEATVQGVTVKSAGGKDIFYAKFNNNFKLQWLKSAGGVKDDNCRGLKVDGIGNAYLAGYIANQANFDDVKLDFISEIGSNIFLTQINAQNGKLSWMRNIEYGVDMSYVNGPVMTVDILQLNEKKEVLLAGIGTGFITNNKDFNFSNDLWVQYLLKYDKNGNLSESKGEFIRQSYNPANWKDIITKKGGYIYSVFNIDSPSRGGGITGIVQFFKSTEVDNCKNNSFLIQRTSLGTFSLAENFIDNHNFNYQWYRNGQYLPNENAFTLKATEPGYYSLKLINKTNSACEVSSSNSIPIFQAVDNYPPILSIDSFKPNTIYFSSLLAPKTEWFLDGKLLIGATGNYSYTYTVDGTYKAKQYFENGTVKESNELVIKDGLVLNVTKAVTYDDGDICKPMPNLIATIANQVFSNDDLKYQWYLNGLAVKDSTFKHFRAVMPGDYHAIIFVVSRNQAYTTGKLRIVTEDFPKSLSITKIEDICGTKALLKVDDSFMQRYTFQSIVWKVDDKVISEATQPFYNANKGGYYTFSVQYKEPTIGKTCTYNSFTTFEKKNDFKLNLGYAYAGSGCTVDSFKVFTEQNPNYTYVWTKNDVPIEKQISSEIFIKDKARYKGIVRRNDGCLNETEEISLKGCTSEEYERFLLINPPNIKTDKIALRSNETSILRVDGCLGLELQWMKNTLPITDAINNTLLVKDIGKYSVRLSKMGCVVTSNSIEVISDPILATTEENPTFTVSVYPNPTEEKLVVSLPEYTTNTEISAKITDISGKLIENYHFSTSTTQVLDLKSFQVGVYLLVIEVGGKRIVRKIIKNN